MIKDVCTLKCCRVTVTMGSSVPCIPDRNSLSANTKALLDEVAGRNFFRFISLDAFACSVLYDPHRHTSGISVASHLFMVNVEYCQNVTGVEGGGGAYFELCLSMGRGRRQVLGN